MHQASQSLRALIEITHPSPLRSHDFFTDNGVPLPEPGSLDGEPCFVEEYLYISSDYGHYDLIDGFLVSRPMPDDALSTWIGRYVDRNFRVRVVSRAHPRLFDSLGVHRVSRLILSLVAQAVCRGTPFFSPGNLQHLILEITSGNINNDIIRKRNLYEKARIEYYFIVNRLDRTVESYVLRNGS